MSVPVTALTATTISEATKVSFSAGDRRRARDRVPEAVRARRSATQTTAASGIRTMMLRYAVTSRARAKLPRARPAHR